MNPEELKYREALPRLIGNIKRKVMRLKARNRELEQENQQLKDRIEEIREGQTDIFSALSENERMALRHQITGLISKIDDHLEDES